LVLCLGPDADTLLDQAVQALAAGNAVLAAAPGAPDALRALRKEKRLPLVALDGVIEPASLRGLPVDAVAFAGDGEARAGLRRALAERDGPIVLLISDRIAPAAYCAERSVCVDTTAAGGNASLLAEASA